MFDGGELKLVILALIAEKPRYGYDVIKALGERVGGDYSPSPGVVYPTLTLLEEMGYASGARTSRAASSTRSRPRARRRSPATSPRSTRSSPGSASARNRLGGAAPAR